MADVIDELLAHPDVRRAQPASPHTIQAVEDWLGVPQPEPVLRLWQASDGLALDTIGGDVLGPSDLAVFQTAPAGPWMAERGFLPIVYDRQSNYLGLIVRGPAAPRVVYLSHEDGTLYLRYRDLDSCITDLLDALRRGRRADEMMYSDAGEYAPDAPRPVEDQITARELLRTDGALGEWTTAVQLLDESNFDTWEKLLDIPDGFVRAFVRERMAKMRSPDIRELLEHDAAALEAFSAQVTEASQQAGLPVGARDGAQFQLGDKWINLEVFFFRRRAKDAVPRIVLWISDQYAGRDPQDRPGNILAD